LTFSIGKPFNNIHTICWCFEYISYEIVTDVQTTYIVIFAIKTLFDRNQIINTSFWRKFFLLSIDVVVIVWVSVVEVVVTSVTSVASVVWVSVGVVVKLRISLGFTLGNNMFGGYG